MKRLEVAAVALAAALGALTLSLPARADDHRGGGHEGERGHEGRGGEQFRGSQWHGHIERFHERDFHLWSGGHWEHRYHDGHYGWWWLAGGLWYYYPAPIYPYPDPYAPPVVVAPPVAAPPVAAAPEAPPTPQYWYYCDAAGGYYPYVPSCPSGWRPVPAR